MSGLPLVLVGGWGVSVDAVASVARGWPGQVVALSVHGDPGTTAEPEQWVRQQLARVPAPAVWVGWSLGGQLAMLAARLAPEQVAGVVTLCSTPRFVAADDGYGMPARTFDQFAAQVAADPVRAWKRFLLLQVRGDARETEGRAAWQPWLKGGPAWSRHSLLAGLAWLRALDERSAWDQSPVPRQHIFGERDRLVDPRLARDGIIANATVAPGMAHWPFGPHADLISRQLQAFVRVLVSNTALAPAQ